MTPLTSGKPVCIYEPLVRSMIPIEQDIDTVFFCSDFGSALFPFGFRISRNRGVRATIPPTRSASFDRVVLIAVP